MPGGLAIGKVVTTEGGIVAVERGLCPRHASGKATNEEGKADGTRESQQQPRNALLYWRV